MAVAARARCELPQLLLRGNGHERVLTLSQIHQTSLSLLVNIAWWSNGEGEPGSQPGLFVTEGEVE
jgi:hypothetical protein